MSLQKKNFQNILNIPLQKSIKFKLLISVHKKNLFHSNLLPNPDSKFHSFRINIFWLVLQETPYIIQEVEITIIFLTFLWNRTGIYYWNRLPEYYKVSRKHYKFEIPHTENQSNLADNQNHIMQQPNGFKNTFASK